MNTRRHTTSLLKACALTLFASAFLCRCASMMTPTGGPKDTLPPVVVAMTPENYTTRFKGGRIFIEFDEFVQLKDQQKEFFTSPQMKKKPTLTVRGRGVVVDIKDTLDENTTYALNFGSTIRDNNEGNPLNALRFVFSTGDEIDSLLCSGYTADAYKADSVGKSFIWFFLRDSVEAVETYDSTLFKYKPSVIARAENNGIFIAQNLKPAAYRVYAMEDRNDNQMYEPGVDQVGFLGEAVNPAELPDFAIWYDSLRQYPSADPQLYFRMFTDKAFRRQLLVQSERPLQHQLLLYFGAERPQITGLRFDSIPDERVVVEPLTHGRDTLAVWFRGAPAELPDTVRGEITYFRHDSLNLLQEVTEQLKLTWRRIETKEQEREREREERARRKAEEAGEEYTPPEEKNPFAIRLSLKGDINPERGLTAEFDYPLEQIDSAALQLTRTGGDGTTEEVPVRMVRDTFSLRSWRIEAPWRPASQYTLKIPEGALTDIIGQRNDSIVGQYETLDPEKYATVRVRVREKGDGAHYILQLLNGAGKLLDEKSVTTGEAFFNYVPEGEIKFRVIEDANGNGRWDTGNLVERRQPERAEFYTDERGEEIFVTKANWEIELEMEMGRIFAPETMESLMRLLDTREMQRLQREAEKRAGEGQKKSGHSHGGGSLGVPGLSGLETTNTLN